MSLLEKIYRYYFHFISRGREPLDDPPVAAEDWGELFLRRFTRSTKGTKVFFTNRHGGVSNAPYDSLNLGYHVGDDESSVTRNREILCSVLGLDNKRITTADQQHSHHVKILENENVGSGAQTQNSVFKACDGLITTIPGVPLLFHFADCVPVVLTAVTPENKPAIAVVHAGRKGLMSGIIGNAVDLMKNELGIHPYSIIAAIGPSIDICCYEVDEETAKAFKERFGPGTVNNRFLDLKKAAWKELVSAGVYRDHIYLEEACTSCNDSLFSYRRDGVTGRQGAIAWIE